MFDPLNPLAPPSPAALDAAVNGGTVTINSNEPAPPLPDGAAPAFDLDGVLASHHGSGLAPLPEWMTPAASAPADPGPPSAADLADARAKLDGILDGPRANATRVQPHTPQTPDASPAPFDPNGWNERERRAA